MKNYQKMGERKIIKKRFCANKSIDIVAELVDFETSIIELIIKSDDPIIPKYIILSLTNLETEELIDRLHQAISILPVSK